MPVQTLPSLVVWKEIPAVKYLSHSKHLTFFLKEYVSEQTNDDHALGNARI